MKGKIGGLTGAKFSWKFSGPSLNYAHSGMV